MTDARSLIMGSGSPGFSFAQPGDTVTGQILTEPKSVQQRNFHDGQPAFWPSGDPKMQVVFQIQTSLRNYEGIANPDRSKPDDGVRTIFLKGKHMEKATKEAILAAGASWLDIGGWVSFTYTGDDISSKAASKPKFFAVKYQPGPPPRAPQGGMVAPQQQGYQGNGFAQQSYPPAPQQAWQQPGWTPSAPPAQPAYPYQGQGFPQPPAPATPVTPPHHGQPEQMPPWAAGPASAPPAPSSAPPAPALSTLDAIRAAQTSATPDYGSVQPAF